MTTNEKRAKRVKQTAEVFTPPKLVNEMLDKLPAEVWEEKEENTFIDPACGNGNFLIQVLHRKLNLGHDPTEALKSIYGLDIMDDNIKECRIKLLTIISAIYDTPLTLEHIKTVFTNIRYLDLTKKNKRTGKLIHPGGSLNYDMSFEPPKGVVLNHCKTWLKQIKKGEMLLADLHVEDVDEISTVVEGPREDGTERIDMFAEGE